MQHLQSTILGFPRIGAQRELKRVLERFWKNNATKDELLDTARSLRALHRKHQLDAGIDIIPVNDFSLYDTTLDLTFQLGIIPERYKHLTKEDGLRRYFAMARGEKGDSSSVTAMEMSKWFDTNYHYIVPEFAANAQFADLSKVSPSEIKAVVEIEEAKADVKDVTRIRPVFVGPVTYLKLGKSTDGSNPEDLFPKLLVSYISLLKRVAETGVKQIQLDEPLLATDLDETTKDLYVMAYKEIAKALPNTHLFLATYFDDLYENVTLVAELPVDIVHIDLTRGGDESVAVLAKAGKRLSLGLIDGRNIWKAHVKDKLDEVTKLVSDNKTDKSKTWFVSSSCSLLHSPFDVSYEKKMPLEIVKWLSFAIQKLREISLLSLAYNALTNNQDNVTVFQEIDLYSKDVEGRTNHKLVHKPQVKKRVSDITPDMAERKSDFSTRKKEQQEAFHLPPFPTTTIGSYPQTTIIRKARAAFKKKELSLEQYQEAMKENIKEVIQFQKQVDIDVFVHGEPERNDMVEYFGENFDGFVASSNGWVQSYGSRCVKPPVIYGDLTRNKPITVEWIAYAQSLTDKLMKAMLTGPITILQWSFVRDDQPRKDTAMQIALLIRDEVKDLEDAGISVIQVDEPAIREGLPLRKRNHGQYLKWSVEAFKVSTCTVRDQTQIHTHMCYSEFNDMIESIAALDADVISIEASRSRMDLLDSFKNFQYPNDIGPGVYDIHSPRVPSVSEMVDLIESAMKYIPKEQLWVNPDCGLKTRGWSEVKLSLSNMVEATKELRKRHSN